MPARRRTLLLRSAWPLLATLALAAPPASASGGSRAAGLAAAGDATASPSSRFT